LGNVERVTTGTRVRITAIEAYRVDLPLHEGRYSWSGGKSVSVFDSTVVRIETDAGLVGFGESCPLGPVYLPSFAGSVRAGLAELAPHVIGADVVNLKISKFGAICASNSESR
jgi:cis-L-3-hydroxyproline dehydratase